MLKEAVRTADEEKKATVFGYRVSDPELYQLYKTHLEIEEQFPLIILCTTYADSFEANDLKVMRQRFVDIFYGLNNTVHAESTLMTEITDLWDLD